MSHLLHVMGIASQALQRKEVTPLALDFPVAAECAPFLVSSSSSVMWIPEAFKDGDTAYVKAAVRRKLPDLGVFYREIVEAVRQKGAEARWGNVSPGTPEGIRAAIEYVKSYDLTDLEILAPVKAGLGAKFQGLDVRPTPWLPTGCYVVVPKDRLFVGFVSRVAKDALVSVVHNGSRGLGIAWTESASTEPVVGPTPEPEPEPSTEPDPT